MADQEKWTPAGFDVTTPNHARVYDYVLGGKDNFAVDREAAEKVLAVLPDSGMQARANRSFLVRVVRFAAESGVRQFIDLGTGIPTSPNVHEVARDVDPSARVVYVDNDPMVVAHSRALLATGDGVIAIQGDIRQPDAVLTHPAVQALIDFGEPVGVLFVAVLHLITDEEGPAEIVARFREHIAPGSYVAVSQFAADSDHEATVQLQAIYVDTPTQLIFRPRDEILRFFDGFDLVQPGLVGVEQWRPDVEASPTALKVVGGVGRKV